MRLTQTNKNILANFIARTIGFVMTYLFAPIYLKILGIESFGLIGFFSTMMGVLLITDLGLTASLTRETARLSVIANSESELKNIIRTYESIYIYVALILVVAVWLLSSCIANNWLNLKNLNGSEVVISIKIMGFAIAFQLPSTLYFGGMMGLQKQILANIYQLLWNLFKGIGTILVLWFISPTILSFAVCQLLLNILYFLTLRRSIWRSIPNINPSILPVFDKQLLIKNWKYSIGIAGISFLSTIILQSDKILVSKLLSIDYLGYYTIASTLALFPIMISNPITTAIFPRFISLIELEDKEKLFEFYHNTCKLVAVVIFPICVTIIFFSSSVVFVWTGSDDTAIKSSKVASILILGQLLQVITSVPFYFASAIGKTKLIFFIQFASIFIFIPLLFILIPEYGIVGASISWLSMNLIIFPFYMYYLHEKYIPNQFWKWLYENVILPLLVITPIVIAGRFIFPYSYNSLIIFSQIVIVWLLSTISLLLILSKYRIEVIRRINLIFNK
jgi:O-antigen/teichoic acid export membrane protein